MCFGFGVKISPADFQNIRLNLCGNFLAGRMPYRKQFAQKFILPMFAMVLSLSQFIHQAGGNGHYC
jgi:hypothetical protein